MDSGLPALQMVMHCEDCGAEFWRWGQGLGHGYWKCLNCGSINVPESSTPPPEAGTEGGNT